MTQYFCLSDEQGEDKVGSKRLPAKALAQAGNYF